MDQEQQKDLAVQVLTKVTECAEIMSKEEITNKINIALDLLVPDLLEDIEIAIEIANGFLAE
jgi:hypothetical protein